MIKPLPHIAAMAPYALARLEVPPGKSLISLSQNESLRPPSPKAIQTAVAAAHSGGLYPDPDWTDLRAAIADVHQIPAAEILCGAGSLDLISALMRVYAGPDRAVLLPRHAYPFFGSAAQMVGARVEMADEVDSTVDVAALLEAVTPKTAMVCVANPGNPTGTALPNEDLIHLRACLPDRALLVVDEAYGEFSDTLKASAQDLAPIAPNTVILRTFSKAYGLAGYRVGWGRFPAEIAAEMRKVMNPNNLSTIAQAAATAAMHDQAYMRETCAMTIGLRDWASAELMAAGFTVLPSHTNFLLIDLGTSEIAQAADATLRANGIFLRLQGGAGLPQCLRMTIAEQPLMEPALRVLKAWKGQSA